jgi:hypothetical protein
MDRSNFAAELCQNRNNTVAAPGFSCPNPMPHPFDTETDSDPDPDLASPLTFSDDLQTGKGQRLPSVSSVSSVAHTILTGGNMVLGWTHPLARRRIGQKRNFDHQPKRRRSWATRAADYLRDCIVVFEEYGWGWTFRSYRERDGWIPEHGRVRDDPQPAMQATVWVKRFQLWDNNGMQGAQS